VFSIFDVLSVFFYPDNLTWAAANSTSFNNPTCTAAPISQMGGPNIALA